MEFRIGITFETLERRELLVGDLATISGTVFHDANDNGMLDGGETGLSGVNVELTGTNDLGENVGPVNAVTDANGSYVFSTLRAGTYQVSQLPPPPAGFNVAPGASPAMVVISAEQANGSEGVTIDSFNQTPQTVTASASGPRTASTSMPLAPEAIGGERDLFAQLDSPSGFVNLEANFNFPQQLAFVTGPSSIGSRRVTWDGADGNPGVLSPTGLGGLDLTDDGIDRFRFLIGSQNGGTSRLRVHTDADNASEASFSIPETPGGEGSQELLVLFTDFMAISGTGADFTNVGAIEMLIDPENASDGQVDLLETFGPTIIRQNFANEQIAPGIDIEKATNGQDADSGTGPLVAVDSTVTFTYVVTNTGDTALGNVALTDDQGVVPSFSGGDTDNDGMLDVSETWTYQATQTATAGQYSNVGAVTANPVDDNGNDLPGLADVSASDPSHHFGVSAGIDIEKATNNEDADVPSGPQVAVGSSVTFTYVVRNTGTTTLDSVSVTDDQGVVPVFDGGDTDSDGRLDVGETWNYSATRVATEGQYANTGSVVANPVEEDGQDIPSLSDVTDSDPSHHTGVRAGIDIEKATNGQDADTPTGPHLLVGSTVTFTYVLTNTGTTALGSVLVTDDQGVVPNRIGGDTDGDNLLDVAETWTFDATAVVTEGQYANLGTVTANPVDDTGVDIAGIGDVSDSDPSHHLGVTTGIDIEKATNGQDADTPTGPQLAVGSTATFTYVVTNTGTMALGSVSITDDQSVVPNFDGGDTDNDNLLDVDEIWTYDATRVVTAGQYANIGQATGNPVDANGGDLPGLADVTDTDPSHHFGFESGIDIEKSTNGQDADTVDLAPQVFQGQDVTFSFTVRNTGNVPLSDVSVSDDNGTPTDPVDDFFADFSSGDMNGDGLLDPSEVWLFTATRPATVGTIQNLATATAIDPADEAVQDSDPSHHTGIPLPPLFSKRRFLASS